MGFRPAICRGAGGQEVGPVTRRSGGQGGEHPDRARQSSLSHSGAGVAPPGSEDRQSVSRPRQLVQTQKGLPDRVRLPGQMYAGQVPVREVNAQHHVSPVCRPTHGRRCFRLVRSAMHRAPAGPAPAPPATTPAQNIHHQPKPKSQSNPAESCQWSLQHLISEVAMDVGFRGTRRPLAARLEREHLWVQPWRAEAGPCRPGQAPRRSCDRCRPGAPGHRAMGPH